MVEVLPEEEALDTPLLTAPDSSEEGIATNAGGEKMPGSSSAPGSGIRTPHTRIV